MKEKMDNKYIDGDTKKWYEEYPKGTSPCKHTKTEVEVINLKNEAKKHLDGETAAFQLKQSKTRDSEFEWLKTALSKGTSQDKIAAAIVLIQDNPKYNLARLITLISQINTKHNQSNTLISLRDLFLSDLLHPEYKLLKFEDQDLDQISSSNQLDGFKVDIPRKKLLSHWYFEDQLKDQYEKFITVLSTVASDTVDANRELAISIMTDLLISNSEMEHQLLQAIVNKVGDPRSKVASKAVFCLNKLLLEHPNMKLVVLREIEKLLFRTNIAPRAQYYAICLLTQFVLNREDSDTASTLINVYFAFFKACLKKGEPDSRMMAAILTGVNRAYRFANLDTVKLTEHIHSVYKVVHVGSFNVSLNALSLLHQVVGKDAEQENRFYTAFYRKLLDPQIGVASKRAIFLNLLYRVMKSDKSVTRLYAFVKRTLQVSIYYPTCMICAILYVISQVINSRKDLKQMLLRPPVVVKTEKEMKDETLNESTTNKNTNNAGDDDDNDDDDDIEIEENTIMLPNVIADDSAMSSNDTDKKDVIKLEEDNAAFYDPFYINPLRSGACKSSMVELTALADHVHPSVALFATNIIEGKTINYTGDPLEDLTLIRFLDRYVFKNPKKLDEKNIVKSNDPLAIRAQYIPKGLRSLSVESQAYLNESEDRIPVDELFLYRYLRNKNDSGNMRVKDDDSDNESVNSEEFNEMLDRFSGNKDFEELDIAADIGSLKNKKSRQADVDNEDDDDNDDEDEDEESIEGLDEELDGSDDDMMFDGNDDDNDDMSDIDLDEIDDEDLSDMEFNDEDDEDVDPSEISKVLGSKKLKNSKKGGKSKGIDKNVFVSAEEFAEMLEEQGRSKRKQGGSDMFSDADGASVKQLDWEISRNHKLSGKFGGKKRPHGKGGFKNNKNVKKFKRKN
ncbi:hypothetical protein PV328_000220 [Microctonus aethiopoides]|uniref:CCAAT-binding factor domain-containing protein n=1 Tax=Microctonus aethiopoides TaxID=144406 RepID=A0AA39FUN2_9HYME|nr:hypothetical protein PV328_000220 [Microctonus aethiopoides]